MAVRLPRRLLVSTSTCGVAVPRSLEVDTARLAGCFAIAPRHPLRWRRFSSTQQGSRKPKENPAPQQEKETKTNESASFNDGDRLILMGMFSGVGSLLARGGAVRFLRFGGAVPMAIGAVVSLYQVGGWALVFAVPASIAAVWTVRSGLDGWREKQLLQEITSRLREALGSVDEELYVAIGSTMGIEYETNCWRCEVEWPGLEQNSDQWRILARADRSTCLHGWNLSKLVAERGDVEAEQLPEGHYAAQTRDWTGRPSTQWRPVWQLE